MVGGDKIDLKPLLGQDTLKAGVTNPALLGLLGNLKLSADIEGQEAVIARLLGGVATTPPHQLPSRLTRWCSRA